MEPEGRALVLLPQTKAQRMNCLKEKWAKISQVEHTATTDLDVKRATLLAEALGEETLDGQMTEKDMAEAIGLTQPRITQLLRYERFLAFGRSLNITAVILELPERRFRQYWQQMHDPFETRGRRTREYRDQREHRVFLAILECLEAGKAPLPPNRVPKKPTVDQMFTTKNPLRALRKEVERRFDTELAPIVKRAKDFFGRDRATYVPDFMANAMVELERWHKSLLQLLADFDKHVD